MRLTSTALCLFVTFSLASDARAQRTDGCRSLPSHDAVRKALADAQAQPNGGLGFHMWATLVDRDGGVCVVAFSGSDRGDQWPGSRVISAQKANTANAFSLPKFALSTANLYTAVQAGQSLFGLQHSNPVDTSVAYGGNGAQFGTTTDPMIGHRVGGPSRAGSRCHEHRRPGRERGGTAIPRRRSLWSGLVRANVPSCPANGAPLCRGAERHRLSSVLSSVARLALATAWSPLSTTAPSPRAGASLPHVSDRYARPTEPYRGRTPRSVKACQRVG